jgi:hypothetical protein
LCSSNGLLHTNFPMPRPHADHLTKNEEEMKKNFGAIKSLHRLFQYMSEEIALHNELLPNVECSFSDVNTAGAYRLRSRRSTVNSRNMMTHAKQALNIRHDSIVDSAINTPTVAVVGNIKDRESEIVHRNKPEQSIILPGEMTMSEKAGYRNVVQTSAFIEGDEDTSSSESEKNDDSNVRHRRKNSNVSNTSGVGSEADSSDMGNSGSRRNSAADIAAALQAQPRVRSHSVDQDSDGLVTPRDSFNIADQDGLAGLVEPRKGSFRRGSDPQIGVAPLTTTIEHEHDSPKSATRDDRSDADDEIAIDGEDSHTGATTLTTRNLEKHDSNHSLSSHGK